MNRTKSDKLSQEPQGFIRLCDVKPFPRPKHGDTWGRWRFDSEYMVLEDTRGTGYWIPLNRCTDSAGVLDWVCQINDKTWASAEDVGDLIEALDDLFDRMQSKICGLGFNKSFDPVAFLKKGLCRE